MPATPLVCPLLQAPCIESLCMFWIVRPDVANGETGAPVPAGRGCAFTAMGHLAFRELYREGKGERLEP